MARDGENKGHNGKKAVKLLVPYSLFSRHPLSYAKLPEREPGRSRDLKNKKSK